MANIIILCTNLIQSSTMLLPGLQVLAPKVLQSIVIIWYCNLLKYCNKFSFDMEYYNEYCKITKYLNTN